MLAFSIAAGYVLYPLIWVLLLTIVVFAVLLILKWSGNQALLTRIYRLLHTRRSS